MSARGTRSWCFQGQGSAGQGGKTGWDKERVVGVGVRRRGRTRWVRWSEVEMWLGEAELLQGLREVQDDNEVRARLRDVA